MAFDLDDEELEMTRVHINHLPPKKVTQEEPKQEDVKENDSK